MTLLVFWLSRKFDLIGMFGPEIMIAFVHEALVCIFEFGCEHGGQTGHNRNPGQTQMSNLWKKTGATDPMSSLSKIMRTRLLLGRNQ